MMKRIVFRGGSRPPVMKLHKPGAFAVRAAALLLCAALCLALCACGKAEDDGPTLLEGPRFTVAVAQTPDSFNPVTAQSTLAEEFFLLCYDPLWRLDAAGRPQACLAESWSLSSDRLTWTIRLRHDAVFSDGRPVTAADVLFTYELMRHNDTAYSEYFDGVTAIRQPDDYTIVISTSYVKGDMLYNPTPILPRHIWKDYEYDPSSFDNGSLIGSGPFIFDASVPSEDGWLFRARADHFGGVPGVGEVFFSSYGTVTGAARAVSTGDADASFGLSDVQLTTLESVPGVELIQAILPEAECALLVLNCRTDFFENEALRRVAEYSADREWFMSMAVGAAGMTGSSFMSPGQEYFAVPDGLRGYDPGAAQGILRNAGYADVDDDGVLEYGLRELKLTLRLISSSREDWASTAATILAADLGELGVRVDWRKTDNSVTSVCEDNDGWDMCLIGFRGSCSPAVTASRFMEQIGALAGWSDEAFESDLAMLRSSQDDSIAKGYARRLQQDVYDACPVVVLGYAADIQAIRSDAWTGYEDQLAGSGLFCVGSADFYLHVTPRTTDAEN